MSSSLLFSCPINWSVTFDDTINLLTEWLIKILFCRHLCLRLDCITPPISRSSLAMCWSVRSSISFSLSSFANSAIFVIFYLFCSNFFDCHLKWFTIYPQLILLVSPWSYLHASEWLLCVIVHRHHRTLFDSFFFSSHCFFRFRSYFPPLSKRVCWNWNEKVYFNLNWN